MKQRCCRINPITGVIDTYYDTVSDAVNSNNYPVSHTTRILSLCNKDIGVVTYNGWIWQWEKNVIINDNRYLMGGRVPNTNTYFIDPLKRCVAVKPLIIPISNELWFRIPLFPDYMISNHNRVKQLFFNGRIESILPCSYGEDGEPYYQMFGTVPNGSIETVRTLSCLKRLVGILK